MDLLTNTPVISGGGRGPHGAYQLSVLKKMGLVLFVSLNRNQLLNFVDFAKMLLWILNINWQSQSHWISANLLCTMLVQIWVNTSEDLLDLKVVRQTQGALAKKEYREGRDPGINGIQGNI